MSIRAIILTSLAIIIIIAFSVLLAFQISPWPSILLIRRAFNQGGAEKSAGLEKHLPSSVISKLDEQYDPLDPDAWFDIHFPNSVENNDSVLTTIIWVHGGGWVAGNKSEVANYCKILASHGFTVVALNYSLAPGKTYPTPVRQVNTALQYLTENAKRLHINPSRLVLAGDSGGAHIASQVANIITMPSYADMMQIKPGVKATSMKGLILYCGPYAISDVDIQGPYGNFMKTVLWAYSGDKNFKSHASFSSADVIHYVTPTFPPTFISVGNGDPLSDQSHQFAKKLTDLHVRVDSLFFEESYYPLLQHEYQFTLDHDAGKLALERSVAFLASLH